MYIAGIDPGFTGALAVLQCNEDLCRVAGIHDAPIIQTEYKKKGKTKIRSTFNVPEMVRLLNLYPNLDTVVIEDVTARTGQGVTSMFRFGHGLGLWEGIVAGLEIPCLKVLPAKWKKMFDLLKKEKRAAIEEVQKRYPAMHNVVKLVKHHGRADAMLLATYGVEFLTKDKI